MLGLRLFSWYFQLVWNQEVSKVLQENLFITYLIYRLQKVGLYWDNNFILWKVIKTKLSNVLRFTYCWRVEWLPCLPYALYQSYSSAVSLMYRVHMIQGVLVHIHLFHFTVLNILQALQLISKKKLLKSIT